MWSQQRLGIRGGGGCPTAVGSYRVQVRAGVPGLHLLMLAVSPGKAALESQPCILTPFTSYPTWSFSPLSPPSSPMKEVRK